MEIQGMSLRKQEKNAFDSGKITISSSTQEIAAHENLLEIYKNCPIPDSEKLDHLGLFLKRQTMSRIIYMYELYKKIISVQGVVIEFGVNWGQNLALFQAFRGMLEPFNYNRKIIGFDTFEGFPSVAHQDKQDIHKVGDLSVSKSYEQYLEMLLKAQEEFSPLSHIKKFDIRKGDATTTFKKYLEEHQETIIAFAYFDFDLYEPTKICLELCKDRFTKGSVIGFDELSYADWPGETLALKETLGLNKVRIERFSFNPGTSFIVVE